MIKIIAIGKIKEKPMQALIQEFEKRLKPIHKVETIELNNSLKPEHEIDSVKEDEGQRILAKIAPKDFVILLELKGDDHSSPAMAQILGDKLDAGINVVFVIGGSHGVSETIKARANKLWRISNLTFPHQLVRLMLIEQIYRMFMIQKNHPYHK